MKKGILSFALSALICVMFVACESKREVVMVMSTPDVSWQVSDGSSVKWEKGDAETVVDLNKTFQTIEGFGTCFNELGWTSLSLLPEEDRLSIMKELFAPGIGANFTICRMPVGANDFSRNWYSYNETEGDFEMKNFSISNDYETLIPFIKEAQKYNPSVQIGRAHV